MRDAYSTFRYNNSGVVWCGMVWTDGLMDETADAMVVAADLVGQAEHGYVWTDGLMV